MVRKQQEDALPGMSIHAVDVSRGVVAAGMKVEVFALSAGDRRLLARGAISAKGTLDDPALDATLAAGAYEAVFAIGGYYRDAKRSEERRVGKERRARGRRER